MIESARLAALAVALRTMGLNPKLVSTALLGLRDSAISDHDLIEALRSLDLGIEMPLQKLISEGLNTIERTIESGVTPIPIGDIRYPFALSEIDDPPPVLYLRGDVEALNLAPGLAIVGTRKATRNGLVVAGRIAEHFGKRDWLIVSGLAMGIDAAAHRGALNAGARTIAVLAHGLEEVYPKTNKNLADEILQNGGAFVSEYPYGVPAKPEQFVLRNRIQIGLSAGSVIVEGEEKSGTRTQAEYCLRNRRQLFAVVPTETTAALNLAASLPTILVEKRGATPIRSRDDYEKLEAMIRSKREQLQKKMMASSIH